MKITNNIKFSRRIALATLSVFFIAACEDPIDPPVADPPENEPYTEVWKQCVYRHYWDSTAVLHTLSLTFYPEEKYFYVEQSPFIHPYYLFDSGYDLHYDVRNDTMYLRYPDEEEFDYERRYAKFFVTMSPPDTMRMEYLGPGIPESVYHYEFTRSN
jgi:hypothetical protein